MNLALISIVALGFFAGINSLAQTSNQQPGTSAQIVPPQPTVSVPASFPPTSVTSNQVNLPTSPSTVGSTPNSPVLTGADILSANNQVIAQVALMYQHLGLFITIIVTLVGGVATWMSYVAKKTVHEFVSEWKEKLNAIETDMKTTQTALHDALDGAKASAATYDREIRLP